MKPVVSQTLCRLLGAASQGLLLCKKLQDQKEKNILVYLYLRSPILFEDFVVILVNQKYLFNEIRLKGYFMKKVKFSNP